jgi:hypothetical protein
VRCPALSAAMPSWRTLSRSEGRQLPEGCVASCTPPGGQNRAAATGSSWYARRSAMWKGCKSADEGTMFEAKD